MSRRISTHPIPPTDSIETTIARARKLRQRGDIRKAMVALREACLRDERCAWVWTLYGAWLTQQGRHDDARHALRHALWLRKASGDAPRARVTQRLIDALGPTSAAA